MSLNCVLRMRKSQYLLQIFFFYSTEFLWVCHLIITLNFPRFILVQDKILYLYKTVRNPGEVARILRVLDLYAPAKKRARVLNYKNDGYTPAIRAARNCCHASLKSVSFFKRRFYFIKPRPERVREKYSF